MSGATKLKWMFGIPGRCKMRMGQWQTITATTSFLVWRETLKEDRILLFTCSIKKQARLPLTAGKMRAEYLKILTN
ncbi:hypothetical protein D3C75_708840 [compost metagenome]